MNPQTVLTASEAGDLFIKNAGNFAIDSTKICQKLLGRSFVADYDNGEFSVLHNFDEDGKNLDWEILNGKDKGLKGRSAYQAFEVRSDVTLLAFKPQEHESVVLSIDDTKNIVCGFIGRYRQDYPAHKVKLFPVTGNLSEKSFDFAYADLSDTTFTVSYANGAAKYKHLYLNPYYVTWLCYKGTSQHVADTESYFAFEIAPKVYLVAWNEESAPLQLTMAFDFEEKKEYAAFFGYNQDNDTCIWQVTTADIEDISLHGKKL